MKEQETRQLPCSWMIRFVKHSILFGPMDLFFLIFLDPRQLVCPPTKAEANPCRLRYCCANNDRTMRRMTSRIILLTFLHGSVLFISSAFRLQEVKDIIILSVLFFISPS